MATILIAVDPSEQAREALNFYLDNWHRDENKVILLHVVDIPETANEARQGMLSARAVTERWKEGQDNAKKLETQFAKEMKAKGVTNVQLKADGSTKPGHAICRMAESENVTMIVVGSRGMGLIRRTVLGSVSDYVVHHAHCPVMIYQK